MTTLINWTAKRAGGRITITGKDMKTDAEAKIVGVDMITRRPPGFGKPDGETIAVDKTGVQHQLI